MRDPSPKLPERVSRYGRPFSGRSIRERYVRTLNADRCAILAFRRQRKGRQMATDTSEQISNGTVAGLFQFLDYLVDKGYAPSATVRPWRNASRKVFEAMEADGGTSVL